MNENAMTVEKALRTNIFTCKFHINTFIKCY